MFSEGPRRRTSVTVPVVVGCEVLVWSVHGWGERGGGGVLTSQVMV